MLNQKTEDFARSVLMLFFKNHLFTGYSHKRDITQDFFQLHQTASVCEWPQHGVCLLHYWCLYIHLAFLPKSCSTQHMVQTPYKKCYRMTYISFYPISFTDIAFHWPLFSLFFFGHVKTLAFFLVLSNVTCHGSSDLASSGRCIDVSRRLIVLSTNKCDETESFDRNVAMVALIETQFCRVNVNENIFTWVWKWFSEDYIFEFSFSSAWNGHRIMTNLSLLQMWPQKRKSYYTGRKRKILSCTVFMYFSYNVCLRLITFYVDEDDKYSVQRVVVKSLYWWRLCCFIFVCGIIDYVV